MKQFNYAFLFITALTPSIHAQVKDAANNLKHEAEVMGKAFIDEDYTTFAKYTYPKLVQAMGGTAKYKETLGQAKSQLASQGMTITKISVDEPSKVVKSGTEVQSTIPQHTEIKMRQGRLTVTSTLIAISRDNGVTWTFLDTSNKDMTLIRKLLANLSKDITIPPPQQPVHYND